SGGPAGAGGGGGGGGRAPATWGAGVVPRGARPDLAADHLARVEAPTLLVVGGRDALVLDLNRRAESLLRCESRLEVVEGAPHPVHVTGAPCGGGGKAPPSCNPANTGTFAPLK
ncbi:alpha/beta fold hydrolase, partial [Streptomyces sp. NPDC059556]|uniref:alpha/beta fold hydrolase n=1 Tax=Streptomyces sp. NPDC059556 TaxID=3346863 RepID=UPI0036B4AEF8